MGALQSFIGMIGGGVVIFGVLNAMDAAFYGLDERLVGVM